MISSDCRRVVLRPAGWLVHKLLTWNEFNRKAYERMSLIQYMTLQFFLTTMVALPVKMILRIVFVYSMGNALV